MLRIDPSGDDFPGDANQNYAIPSSNPFRNDPNYLPEIWALGLRNPYRFSFDSQTGQLWIGDVGQDLREEVDLEPRFNQGGGGRNYGWKVLEGTRCNFADPQGSGSCPAYVGNCSSPGYTAPLIEYDHNDPNVGTIVGETVIGGFVYHGAAPAWQGRYIFADFSASKIFALTPDGHGGFNAPKPIPAAGVNNPISFGQDHMGELYVLTFGGTVFKIHFPPGVDFSKQQQACVRKLNAGFDALADARSAQVRTCVDRFASGKLGSTTIDMCVDATSNAKLDKLAARNLAIEASQCIDPLPPFGLGGAAAGNTAALDAEKQTLLTDALSDPPDADVILKASDKAGAACQRSVLKTLAACANARRSEFLRCKNAGIKAGTFADAAGLGECLCVDPKLRIQKSCEPKLASAIAKSCTRKSVDLAAAFPTCSTADPAALAHCLADSARAHTCDLFNAADALGIDCSSACSN
jgi:hypothetical protein